MNICLEIWLANDDECVMSLRADGVMNIRLEIWLANDDECVVSLRLRDRAYDAES